MVDSPRPDPEALLAHAPFVREMARALLHGDSRAEDVAQDALVVALQRGPGRPGFLRAWLAGVVRNLVYTVHRRDSARLRRERAAARQVELPSAAAIAAREETRARLVRAVLGLGEPYRSAVLLRYYEDLPPRQIARRLGVPAETARTRVRRGLALLRGRLDDANGGDRSAWTSALAPLLVLPGKAAAGGSAAAGIAGGALMGTNVKLVVGIAVLVLLCVGASYFWLGPEERAAPPGETPEETAALPAPDSTSPAPAEAVAEAAPATPGETGAPVPDEEKAAAPGAREPKPPGFGRPGPAGTVGGTVRAEGSDEPLAGVEVVLEYDDNMVPPGSQPAPEKRRRVTETDEKGEFRVRDLVPGIYRITFSHPDYAHRTLTRINVFETQGIEGIAVPMSGDLDTLGAIAGRVTDLDGLPLPDRRVVVHSQKQAVRVETTTDEDGRYGVERLVAGYYRVSLLGGPKETADGDTRGAEDLYERSATAAVVPRETTTVDFSGSGALTGVVVDSEDQPLPGIVLELVPAVYREGWRQRKAETGDDGTFRIENAGTGYQSVLVRHKGGVWCVQAETVNLSGYDQEIRIRLPAGEIGGRVLLAEEGGEGVPPLSKSLVPGMLLYPAVVGEAGAYEPRNIALALPDAKGDFRFRGIPAGRYRLRVVLDGYSEIVRELELDYGQRITDLDLALEKLRLGRVRITAKDAEGKPVDGLIINYGWPGKGWRSAHTTQPESGRYVAEKIEVGEWTFAFGRKDLQMKTVKAAVVEGETTEVSVVMEKK